MRRAVNESSRSGSLRALPEPAEDGRGRDAQLSGYISLREPFLGQLHCLRPLSPGFGVGGDGKGLLGQRKHLPYRLDVRSLEHPCAFQLNPRSGSSDNAHRKTGIRVYHEYESTEPSLPRHTVMGAASCGAELRFGASSHNESERQVGPWLSRAIGFFMPADRESQVTRADQANYNLINEKQDS